MPVPSAAQLQAALDQYARTQAVKAVEDAVVGGGGMLRWGTVTGVAPLDVRLHGDSSALGYSPPLLGQVSQVGERVLCAVWSRQVVVLGSTAPPPARYDDGWTDSGWYNASFYTPNGFAQSSGGDKLQVREIGNDVRLRGSFRRTAAGGGFGNGCLVGLPQSPQTQHVGIAQWESGARCDLVIYAGDTEVVPDIIASSGTFGVGWVRIGAGAGYTLDPW